MNIGMIYAVVAGASLLQLILIYNRTINTKYKETIDVPFRNLLIYCSCFCFVDMWWGICDARPFFVSNDFFNFVTYCYHTLGGFSAYIWFGYILKYIKAEGKTKTTFNIVRTVLLICQISLFIANFFNHQGFYVDEEMNYSMGTMRLFMYCLQFFYYIVIVISSLLGIFFDSTRRKIHKNVLIFSMIPLIFGICQYIFYDVAMYSIGFTIAAFVIYAYNLTDIREKHLENLAEEEKYFANIDVLTRLLNRRGYEEDLMRFPSLPPEEDFVYVSMDLDELKKTNDTLGHNAGDEMIQGAADCMKLCLSPYGRLYRTGGDEFVAIIFADPERLSKIRKDFTEKLSSWKGKTVDSLHVSMGFASKREFNDKEVKELAKIAEDRMYSEKATYYSSKGIDRRGESEAFSTLCSLYQKILKINISTDTYHIITMDNDEKKETLGFSPKLSTWIHAFAFSGSVHKDDQEYYLEKTDINFLRSYFAEGNVSLTVRYRRLCKNEYRTVLMEMVVAKDYSKTNQTLYLYVKTID